MTSLAERTLTRSQDYGKRSLASRSAKTGRVT